MSATSTSSSEAPPPGSKAQYIYLNKAALESACHEHGLNYRDLDSAGKPPTNDKLAARLYLSDANGDPDAGLEATLAGYLKSKKQPELVSLLRELQPGKDLAGVSRKHDIIAAIARVMVKS
ncbi:hypothetical protein J7T55_013100 [Diaporthe amygdali]|uniref:uncharacterized protein n=1 Tax=Phomopsis amygdali TaxID=1214568 RepID=UPI0022FE5D76|nr:uncharacterized protein J7T55_013100 [Diaporthe amygdali]KAJ0118844.1 hypothetical protein J7T55_013100 [Diaporthe amygdali]